MFGIGPGALPMDAIQLGLDPSRTREMMVEALEVIIPLLAGETVTAETDWFTLRNAKLQIEPLTRPRMEIAVTSVRSPAGAMLAGRFGLGTLSLGGASDDALAKYAEHGRICQETAAKHGQTVDPAQHRIAVPVHIAETRERAIADVGFGFEAWADYARDVLPFSPIGSVSENRLGFVMETRRAIVGTPDDAIEAIEAIQAGSGGMGAFLIMEQNWADWSAANRSYEMFARYVIPHFRRQFSARRHSYDVSRARHADYVVAARQGVANAQERYREQREAAAEKADVGGKA
jgi:limonene 1,2-monooxygenase